MFRRICLEYRNEVRDKISIELKEEFPNLSVYVNNIVSLLLANNRLSNESQSGLVLNVSTRMAEDLYSGVLNVPKGKYEEIISKMEKFYFKIKQTTFNV